MHKNKLILNYCPNFYKIINFEFIEGDAVTEKLINLYEEYIFNIDPDNAEDVKLVKELDTILCKYINDYMFRKEMKYGLLHLKINKGEKDILGAIVRNIINIFERYVEGNTTNIYLSKWI